MEGLIKVSGLMTKDKGLEFKSGQMDQNIKGIFGEEKDKDKG